MELFLFILILPFFHINQYDPSQKVIVLDEDTSLHIVQVLRMKKGEQLNLTDGRGNLITAIISDDHKKHCIVSIQATSNGQPATKKLSIAISLLKNSGRFEWFLEKVSEIGVTEIIPLICERTEKQKFRYNRMKGICISAMLQSQQIWLPVLHEPIAYDLLLRQEEVVGMAQKFIAHCMEGGKNNLNESLNKSLCSRIILIGPEGDFSEKEVRLAIQYGFIPVSLGETRLRAETAGVIAATFLKLF
jgi:16S rRNA (uracil1498-N3)-methyltransferase